MNDAATSLSALITSKRRLCAPEQIEATVHATDGRSTRIFHVVARSPTGEYRCATDDETVSFNPRSGELVLEPVNDPPLRTHRHEFPMSHPVLTMFSPLDLPIWDASDNYEVVDAWRNGDSVRLEFAGPVRRGHAIVDLENHVAVELRYLDWLYTVRDLSTTLHGDVGRAV
ncbi:hypothetical protein E7744_15545 (plasmid) [Citricoccus sp. SGAir0253]|uniref:hypothetical protein n=1 Tax=Citricoccus sp. SGAir0253 TaxID=2567881 RepID=UPI0010CCD406|nr:hypothetical protein [Citricoccus sp. SGAir0253]QCU79723.1 hypothetical protein E7744_15545 [Citricoccus sp. SGAir0253]